MFNNQAAAWKLLGHKSNSGWIVKKAIGWDPKTGQKLEHYNGSGGNFSVPYEVEKDGKKAFMKAIDFTSVLNCHNVMDELKKITDTHHFETKILEKCEQNRVRRVVTAIDSGEISIGPNIQDKAPYLIFELAEGDVRKTAPKLKEEEKKIAWWLRSLHHTTIGLSQLHANQIAHQDLKPSNILSFSGKPDFKIADLGRSISSEMAAPHDELPFPGDCGYAPPEILYGYVDPDWGCRRLGTDIYLLGSMIFFYVMGMGITPHLIMKLDQSLRPLNFMGGIYRGNYSDVLPHLQTVFSELLLSFEEKVDPTFRADLTKALSELCCPDPHQRGHPLHKKHRGSNYSLIRYISLFDRLATRAEWNAKGRL